MPHLALALPDADGKLIAASEGRFASVEPGRFSDKLVHWLQTTLEAFDDGVFLRLGGRSFVTADRPPQRVRSVGGALSLLGAPGDRAARMARLCRLAGRPVWLFARQWRQIEPDEEFRLVLQNRTLAAASQYHHRQAYPDLLVRTEVVVARVSDMGQVLKAAVHLPDVVADIWIPRATGASAELIELNPLLTSTGRALLAGEVSGPHPHALHLLGLDGNVIRCPLAKL